MKAFDRLKQKAHKLKSEVYVMAIVYTDKRTPILPKFLIALTVGYLLSPIDLIPDFIPIIGLLDDLIIVPILISASIKLIPPIVLQDARKQINENPQRFKKNNWLFAIPVIFIWIYILYLIYKKIILKLFID